MFVDAGVYVFCAFTIVYSSARADICVIKPWSEQDSGCVQLSARLQMKMISDDV